MSRLIFSAVIALVVLSGSAAAVTFDHIATLGDSLFDDSNGTRSPVAPEHVARALDIGVTKFAEAGSTSSSLIDDGQHTHVAAQFGMGDLAMLWIGGNDFGWNTLNPFGLRIGNYSFLNTLAGNVNTALTTLAEDGMDVLVFNLPDMADVPLINTVLFTDSALENATEATIEWNARLDNLAASHGATVVDIYSLFEDLENNPQEFSLLGNQPVLDDFGCQFCVFVDSLHPSAFAQGFIANEVIDVINSTYDPQGMMPLKPLARYEIAALAGVYATDFDDNNLVNGEDLRQWQAAYGKDTAADANGDGITDGHDFLIWQRQVAATASSTIVPEPTAVGLAFLLATTGGFLRRHQAVRARQTVR